MFDNIAQIEKEVQEFRANILASKELLQHLEDLTGAVNEEHEALVEKMAALQASVERHTTDNTQRVSASVDSLLRGHEKAANDLATEIHTTVESLRQWNTENLSSLRSAVNEEHEALVEKMAAFQASVERHTTDNTQRVSASVDSLLRGHEKAANDLATEIHTTVENLRQGNTENLSNLRSEVSVAMDKNSENLQAVSQKYNEFLAKIESSNLDHIYEYCIKLEHSINQKFMFLGAGIGVIAVLSILSIIL